MTETTLANAAIEYAQKGFAVFPLSPGSKIPFAGTNGHREATANIKQIRTWWHNHPNANIGIPTGQKSGIWVLDIDGPEGESALEELETQYGQLPATKTVKTGTGRHLYFVWPDAGGIKNKAGSLGKGLDIRGDGGYVVVPPSTHESGNDYAFDPESPQSPADAPRWLIELIISDWPKNATPKNERHELLAIAKGVSEGERNDSLTSLAGILLRARRIGLDPRVALELLHAWNEARCSPPLPEDEVNRTVDSIAGRELNNPW